MKSRVRQKLNSRRGASFLLALLFFLICALVSSTVLMAAAANAGRSRSEREEHQRYLTLSSAVRLLCDELTDCQYRGQYYYRVEEITETNPDTGETKVVDHKYYLEQEEGLYQYKDGDDAGLTALLDDFDYLFSLEFDEVKASRPNITVTKLDGLSPPTPRTLTLTPESGVDGLDQEVTVALTVEFANRYVINLTASLGEYAIRATLTTDASRPGLPDSFSQSTYQTAPMTWKVGWIRPADSEGGASNG